jgi:cytochrome c
MRLPIRTAAALALAALFAGTAAAQSVRTSTPANAERGLRLAERLCAQCHAVAAPAAGSTVAADVPSFSAIARQPGQTVETIAGRIVVPHPPMPHVQVSRDEIADLAAYIISLRGP